MATYTDPDKLKRNQKKPRKKQSEKKPTKSTGNLKFNKDKRNQYVKLLLECGGRKAEACRRMGIHRGTVGDWEVKDPEFKEQVAEAIERADEIRMERLESEAEERAIVGAPKVLTHKGVVVWARDHEGNLLEDKNGNPYPLVEYQKSDVLMQTMLKAGNPKKYRENMKVETDQTLAALVVPATQTVEEWVAEQSALPKEKKKI